MMQGHLFRFAPDAEGADQGALWIALAETEEQAAAVIRERLNVQSRLESIGFASDELISRLGLRPGEARRLYP
jgi:hypothetical protein